MLIFGFYGGIISADEKSSTILDSYESVQITYTLTSYLID